ncbi:MAG: hypothetical protein SH820_14895 [Xanthomonadales bacterium]|nr:hypothetical protein [Xanthomonadales bacterium]
MDPYDIQVSDSDGLKMSKEELSKLKSKLYTTASGSNSLALHALHEHGDWGEMRDRLKQINASVNDGDLTCAEALLIDQAYVLQSIFSNYIAKMVNTEYLSQTEAYSKIALRAQNQCQRTLKTLLEYKNPKRTTFIKQQNNTLNQQINEGEKSEKEIKPANELLEQKDGTWMDTRKTKEAVPVNSNLETLGKINRTKDRSRKKTL